MSVGEPLKLVFDAPRRGKPPRHWADLAVDERRPALAEAGLPAFRADQLSRHWFERLETDPSTWTDLPAAQREAVAEAYFPKLLDPVTRQACDDGTTVKTLWRLHDGSLVESVLMRYAREVRSADDLADDEDSPRSPSSSRSDLSRSPSSSRSDLSRSPSSSRSGLSRSPSSSRSGLSRSPSSSRSDLSRSPSSSRSERVEGHEGTKGMRSTICISSQAGCGMACPFCATGQGGLQRNLSCAEIVSQVADGARMLRGGEVPGGVGRINNVVFMGMGEPLANYRAVLGAVRSLTTPEPHGLGISARGVTVSTVGLVPRIRQLATEGLPVTLALSLHAPDDELRDELVPVNNRWPVGEVVDAAYAYARETGRRVSIEYALIRDINDQAHRADLLAKVLRRRGKGWVHVNLIPLNPTPGSKWTASRRADEKEFVRRLEAGGVPVTVRDTRGQEIDGACGQLAATGGKD